MYQNGHLKNLNFQLHIKYKNRDYNLLEFAPDLLIVSFLIVLGLKYIAGFERFTDITLNDESYYLYNGVNLLRNGLPNAQLSPFYSVWYFFLSLFQSDNISLYYLNFEIITVFLPVCIYILLRRHKVSGVAAFIVSFFFLISYADFAAFPKVTHFALIVILFSLILASLFRTYIIKLTVLLIFGLIVSYIRPEFFISFIIFSLIYIIVFIRSYKKYNFRILSRVLITIIILISALVTIGNPLSGGNRGFLAFSQHFSVNWTTWTNNNMSPWRNSKDIIRRNFGDSKTILECYSNNPDAFIRHINSNLKTFSKVMNMEVRHSNLIIKGSILSRKLEFMFLVFSLLLMAIIKLIIKRERIKSQFKENFNQRKELWLMLVIYIIPVTISSLLIYPREHYLSMLIVLLSILFITIIMIPEGKINYGRNIMISMVLGIMFLAAAPRISDLKYFSDYKPNLTIINYLRSLKISDEVNILDAEGGYNIYIPHYNRVNEYSKNCFFRDFLAKNKINMIIPSYKLKVDKRFRSDPEWGNFLKKYEQYGFIKKEIPNSGMELLIKKGLVSDLIRN